ncbi:MAG: DUF7146 domain-containing protein [Steroidobacteraceae bacterium]
MLSDEACGLWADILGALAPELIPAIEADADHVPCPVHGGKDGFRVFNDFRETGGGVCNTCGKFRSGIQLLAWVRQVPAREAARMIHRWLEGERSDIAPAQLRRVESKKPDPSRVRASIMQIWSGCTPIRGTLAEQYLLKRGIPLSALSNRLGFHPSLKYCERIDGRWRPTGAFPAMVAPIQLPDGRAVCLHRTYLSEQGTKANVSSAKKMTMRSASLRGGAIRLFAPQEVLAVAEGIETALAVRAGTGLAVWAAVSATLMESLEVPDVVREVRIFADKDESGRGLEAAERLAKRMRGTGRHARIHLPAGWVPPDAKGIDWLDVYLRSADAAFPSDFGPIRRAA